MEERRFAHPVLDAAGLGDAPVAVRLLGEDVVLWRDASGTPRAAPTAARTAARSCRSAASARGSSNARTTAGSSTATGRCTHIPALPAFVPSASHALSPLRIVQAHGLLWLQLRRRGERCRASTARPTRSCASYVRPLRRGDQRAAHRRELPRHWRISASCTRAGSATAATPTCWTTTACRARPTAHRGYRTAAPGSRRASALATEGSWVDYRYEVMAPFTRGAHQAAAAAGRLPRRDRAVRLPDGAGESRVWFRWPSPTTIPATRNLRAFQHTIFTQDQPVLESQRPRAAAADRRRSALRRRPQLRAAYRRYLRERGITFGVC